jgi:hypothetical protein
MKFELDLLYKNIYRDKDSAFTVDEIIKQDLYGANLVVTWYKMTDSGRYISIGIDGEFYIPKDEILHYVEVI